MVYVPQHNKITHVRETVALRGENQEAYRRGLSLLNQSKHILLPARRSAKGRDAFESPAFVDRDCWIENCALDEIPSMIPSAR